MQVDFALGTDTAGSGRVPAGLQNIVGLKPSKGLLSTRGVFPAAASADCVSIFARTVDVAWRALTQAMGLDVADPFSRDLRLDMTVLGRDGAFTFGVPDTLKFFGDAVAEQCYHEALAALEGMGGVRVVVDYAPLAQVAAMLYEDAFVAERYSAIRAFFDAHADAVIEPVRSIVAKGTTYSAADLYDAQLTLRRVAQGLRGMWGSIDVLVVPTAPTHYTIADMLADPVALNRNLGAYTNFVNLLDYCALSIPSAIRPDGLPFGITLIGTCGSDFKLAELGQRYHHARALPLGATGLPLPAPALHLHTLAKPTSLRLAVVGAHLQGMPLHHQLTSRGAVLVSKCRTAAVYKLYAIANSTPPKPALVYVGSEGGGVAIDIEIYDMTFEAVGSFLTEIPPPLGLGTLVLEEGATVKGFIAEPRAMTGATDISAFGGWRAYISSKPK